MDADMWVSPWAALEGIWGVLWSSIIRTKQQVLSWVNYQAEVRHRLYKSFIYNLVTITHWHVCQVSTGLALLTVSSSNSQEHKPSPHKSWGHTDCNTHGSWEMAVSVSFAAKALAPQKQLHRGEALSPRTAARHPSEGLAPEHCVLPCSLLTFSWSLTEIPTVVLYMAPQQLSSSRRWYCALWHSELPALGACSKL